MKLKLFIIKMHEPDKKGYNIKGEHIIKEASCYSDIKENKSTKYLKKVLTKKRVYVKVYSVVRQAWR